MRRPAFGEANMGALAGAVIGAIGGLFAIGIGPAIASQNIRLLVGTPILAIVSLLLCGPLGWLIGGQIGPRLGGNSTLNAPKPSAESSADSFQLHPSRSGPGT